MELKLSSSNKMIVCYAKGSMPDELLLTLKVLDEVALSEKNKMMPEDLDMGYMVDSYINEVCPKNFDK